MVPTYYVLFILLYGGTSAVERPYATFQPGEYFDPFTENTVAETQAVVDVQPAFAPGSLHRTSSKQSNRERRVPLKPVASVLHPNHQHKQSGVAPPPNVLYANLNQPRPRSIGHTSGTAQQFNPQLFNPMAFLGELEALAKQVDKIRRPRLESRKFEVPQHRTQLQKPQLTPHTQPHLVLNPLAAIAERARKQNIRRIIPNRPVTRVNTPKPQLSVLNERFPSSADISALPLTLQKFYPPQDSSKLLSSTSAASVQPSTVIEPPTAGSSDVHTHHPNSHHSSRHSDSGGGHEHKKEHHKSHGGKEDKGYKENLSHYEAGYKKHEDHQDKSHREEDGNTHQKHHDEAEHYKKFQAAEKSRKSGKFGEKKGHKRGHKTKGYHNKFHRDEYHREHKYYDDFHKEGFHEKNGDKQSYYKKKKGGYKKGRSGKSGNDHDKHGKKGFSKKGRLEEEHKGFSTKGGKENHHAHHRDYHTKGGGVKGKHYGYKSGH
ncbi:uncharacterized protein [Euwallacea similis]|uniref:uncharacterized protein n=1 Tax=Euwallacea similis TaxID=1736056 RepID=UPI00344C839C